VDLCNRSYATLDTAVKMVLDIVDTDNNMEACLFDGVAPSYTYIIRASLEHIYRRAQGKDDGWLQSAEERLRAALTQFNHRWDLNSLQCRME
jgi:hypothetical protein